MNEQKVKVLEQKVERLERTLMNLINHKVQIIRCFRCGKYPSKIEDFECLNDTDKCCDCWHEENESEQK